MTTPSLTIQHGKSIATSNAADRSVQLWLASVAALVLAMIVVGGATRLTDSGLSITEWQPILGAIPPLSDTDWQAAFAKYKTIPQYESVNRGMSLDAFKAIFWWEWAHRFLGRFIGLAFALPFAVLWWTRRIRAGLAPRLCAVLALGAVQGAVGWYMVQSGLSARIDVSQYRLALHLSIAFLILGALTWLILDLAPGGRAVRTATAEPAARTDRMWSISLAALVFSQVALGGFVAGLKAGRAFNTWPLMDGRIIPDGFARLSPWWLNLTENMATVQFNHRIVAYVIVLLALWNAVRVGAANVAVTRSARALAIGVFAQMCLGIWTVLAAVPLQLGIAHQGLAAIVFVIALWHVHACLNSGGRRV